MGEVPQTGPPCRYGQSSAVRPHGETFAARLRNPCSIMPRFEPSVAVHRPRPLQWIAACLIAAGVYGCGRGDPIREYVVPKQPVGGTVWFFKVLGPEAAVARELETIRAFTGTIRFNQQTGVPEWTLPQGWTEELPGTGFRYRTLKIPGTPPLEIAVSHVAGRVPPDEEEVRTHANLLRGQVGLTDFADTNAMTAAAKDGAISPLGTATTSGRLFNFSGTTTRFGETRLVAAMVPSSTRLRVAPPEDASRMAAGDPEDLPFTFDTPEGWKEAPQTQFSLVSLSAADGAKTVSITVTPAMGGLLANVNRWRGQAGLPALNADQIEKELEALDAGGQTVRYSESIGESRAVLGGIVELGGRQWFAKLDGDPELARRERDKFRAFLQSFKFEE